MQFPRLIQTVGIVILREAFCVLSHQPGATRPLGNSGTRTRIYWLPNSRRLYVYTSESRIAAELTDSNRHPFFSMQYRSGVFTVIRQLIPMGLQSINGVVLPVAPCCHTPTICMIGVMSFLEIFTPMGCGTGELKLYAVPLRPARSPNHDSTPRPEFTIPPPRVRWGVELMQGACSTSPWLC